MKKLCFLLILALLLTLSASAFAEGSVEIVVMDGIPVVMETFGLTSGETNAFNAAEDFILPAALVTIEESAFEGIPASYIEITENVKSIGARAFADCENLTGLVIPATVESIDDTALDGSINATVYGAAGSEAQRFAAAAGFDFVDSNAGEAPVDRPAGQMEAPVVLPFVKK